MRVSLEAPVTHAPGHGRVLDELRVDGVRLTEVRHGPGWTLGTHAHDTVKLCVLLEGGVTERSGVDIHASQPLTVVARAADVLHENQYHAGGARSLLAELDPSDGDVRAALAGRPVCGAPPELAQALLHAFRARRSERARRVKAAVRALLDSMATSRRPPPAWLGRAREILVESLVEPPALVELARRVGVHPVHLAQAFRARTGMTPRGFVRSHRVFRALELVEAGAALADAALAAGFADQSHMTRAIHRQRGAAPGALRALGGHSAQAVP